MIKLPTPNSKLAHETVDIYRDFTSEKTDRTQFHYLTCLKALEILEGMKRRSVPHRPHELDDLKDKLNDRRMKVADKIELKERLYRSPVIFNYINDKQSIEAQNKSNITYLKYMCKVFRHVGDETSFIKTLKVLDTYPKSARDPIDNEQGQTRVYDYR